MKMHIDTALSQIVFQGLRTLASVSLIGGIAIMFIENGTGTFIQSLDTLAQASGILGNFVG